MSPVWCPMWSPYVFPVWSPHVFSHMWCLMCSPLWCPMWSPLWCYQYGLPIWSPQCGVPCGLPCGLPCHFPCHPAPCHLPIISLWSHETMSSPCHPPPPSDHPRDFNPKNFPFKEQSCWNSSAKNVIHIIGIAISLVCIKIEWTHPCRGLLSRDHIVEQDQLRFSEWNSIESIEFVENYFSCFKNKNY